MTSNQRMLGGIPPPPSRFLCGYGSIVACQFLKKRKKYFPGNRRACESCGLQRAEHREPCPDGPGHGSHYCTSCLQAFRAEVARRDLYNAAVDSGL